MQIYYMHTINGRPGWFDRETGLIFQTLRNKPRELARSWSQIKREQSIARKTQNYPDMHIYGYIRVSVPE